MRVDQHGLQRHVRVESERGHHTRPRLETFRVGIDVIVKDGTLRWKFNPLELTNPPLVKLVAMIDEQVLKKNATKSPYATENKVQLV